MPKVNVPFEVSTYVSQEAPNTKFYRDVKCKTSYSANGRNCEAYMATQQLPESGFMAGRGAVSSILRIHIEETSVSGSGQGSLELHWMPVSGGLWTGQYTYNGRPGYESSPFCAYPFSSISAGWISIELTAAQTQKLLSKITYVSHQGMQWEKGLSTAIALVIKPANSTVRELGIAFSSIISANKPYLEVEYQEVKPIQTPYDPINKSINRLKRTTLHGVNFQHVTHPFFIAQTRTRKMQCAWRVRGSAAENASTVHEIDDSGGASIYPGVSYPAGTFPEGQIEWRVRGANQWGIWSDWSAWAAFTAYSPGLNVTNLTPAGGIINRLQANTVTWETALAEESEITPAQASAQLKWRVAGQSTEHILSANTAQPRMSVPAGAFPAGVIEYAVRVTTNYGAVGAWSDWVSITTETVPPSVIPLSPANMYIETAQPNLFTWLVKDGLEQQRAELQISSDKLNWTNLVVLNQRQPSYTAAAGTLTPGTLFWRVRATCYGIVSAWSEAAQIIAIGKPDTPQFRQVIASNRPVFYWISKGQQSWELEILQGGAVVYSPGEQAGARTEHKTAGCLLDGQYTVRLRVRNEFGIWSAYCSYSMQIQTQKKAIPKLSVSPVKNAAQLEIILTGNKAGVRLFVLRDGIPVARLPETATVWWDYQASGRHTYQIWALDAQDTLSISNTARVNIQITEPVLAALDEPEKLFPVHLSTERGNIGDSFSMQAEKRFVSGRTNPLMLYDGHEQHSVTVACVQFDSPSDLLSLCRSGKTLLLRDPYGRCDTVAVQEVSCIRFPFCMEYTIRLLAVDRKEEVPFD